MKQRKKLSSSVCSSIILACLFRAPTVLAEEKTAAKAISKELQRVKKAPLKTEEASQESSPDTQDASSVATESSLEEQLILTGDNLLKNPQFDQTSSAQEHQSTSLWSKESASDWKDYKDASKSQGCPKIAVSDNKLTMTSDGNQRFRGCVHQTVAINPDKQYLLTFDIETKDKTGQAFARIIEEIKQGSGAAKEQRLWLSPMATGTEKKHQEKLYIPKLKVNQIKLELFYEAGHGQVVFDNLSLREAGDKPSDDIKIASHHLEEQIVLPLNKHYLMEMADYHYQIAAESSNIVRVENGLLIPLAQGKTLLEVLDQEGQRVATVPVEILAAEDLQTTSLITKWCEVILGAENFDRSSPAMVALNQKLDDSVTKNLADLTKDQKSTYLWSDLADLHQSSHMTATCRRLEEMAKQVSSLASRYYQDKELIRLIKDKLAWLTLNHYHPQKDIEGKANWWDFEIGTPRAIVNTLAFIYPYVTQEEIKRYTKGISHFVPNPRQFRSTLVNPFKAIGGNLVDMGRVKIIEALLKHDKKALQDSIAALDTLFAFQPKGSRGEGFYEDGSYIDHTNVAYTGAYGNVLIDGLSQMVPLLQLLATSLDQQKLEVMTHWIEQAFLPLMVHGELMDMSRGRSISRENASSRQAALEALRGMLRLAEALPEQAKIRIKGKIKAVLAFHNQETILESLSSYYDMKLFKELLEDTTIQASPVKSYLSLFNQMDKLAYYNAEKDFAFALSMHSNKTLNFEAMNDENTRGWYTGDGMFYLYNSDLGHYSDHFWPTVNPLKMAGTTEAEVRREDVTVAYLKKLTNDYKEKAKEKAGMSTLPSSFVGAIKVGDKTALAVMDFQNWDRTVSAKKSWTILDDQIVFLGTAITSQTHQAVTTTIDQRKENPDNSYTLFINGQETALTEEVLYRDDVTSLLLLSKDGQANIGYLFAKPTALALSRKVQSGRWSEINTNSKNEDLISQSFITISQAHSQASDSYAYTLLPNISKADFDKVCSEARIEVLRNDSKLQLIHDKKQDLLAVVKYNQAKEVINGQLSLEKSGLYLYQKVGNDFKQLSFKALS